MPAIVVLWPGRSPSTPPISRRAATSEGLVPNIPHPYDTVLVFVSASDMNPLLAVLLVWCAFCHVRAADDVPVRRMLVPWTPLTEHEVGVQERYIQPQRRRCTWRRVPREHTWYGGPRYRWVRVCAPRQPDSTYKRDYNRGYRQGFRDALRDGCMMAAPVARGYGAPPPEPVPGSAGYREGYAKGYSAGQARACRGARL